MREGKKAKKKKLKKQKRKNEKIRKNVYYEQTMIKRIITKNARNNGRKKAKESKRKKKSIQKIRIKLENKRGRSGL